MYIVYRAAPEVLNNRQYTKYSDIWSYGVLCAEMFLDGDIPSMAEPSTSHEHLFTAYSSGERYPCPSSCRREVFEIITKCWEVDGSKRIQYSAIQQELKR